MLDGFFDPPSIHACEAGTLTSTWPHLEAAEWQPIA